MTIKTISTLIFLMLCGNLLLAQPNGVSDAKCYTYDDAGNRSTRTISVKRLINDSDESAGKDSSDEEKSNETINTEFTLVYPNPTFGLLTIEFNEEVSEAINLAIYDLNGKLLLTEQYQKASTYSVDVSDLPLGEFILNLSYGDSRESWRIIKK